MEVKRLLLVLCEILIVSACDVNCLRKCCPDGQSLNFQNGATECNGNSTSTSILAEVVNLTSFNIIHGKSCSDEMVLVKLDNKLLKFELIGDKVKWEDREFDHTTSCVDTYNDKLVALVCVAGDEEEDDVVASTGMIISMPFLLMTFVVYALLPDRNLHMKALMFYVINLLLSYLLLVIIQLSDTRFADGVCITIGYACLFFFLVSFFWMNVICFDIWLAFSGLRGFSGSKKVAERKRFLLYCLYAWGMPVLHVVLIVIIHNTSETHAWYFPGIGEAQCFLNRGYPELLYFYGPMAIIITINVVLFAITAFKIRSIKKDTSMLKKEDSKRHSYENDKQTFNLYLKLLFAMGVNWSMEIISWAVNWAGDAPDFIWYLTDFCNAIYGVFIFFIFVFKKSIWKLLKKRYYSFMGKSHLAHSMTMSNTTRVTSYSTANSSVADNPHGINDTSTLTSEA